MSASTSGPVPRQPVRRRVTAASPTPEKLATFLRHLEESGSVSLAAAGTGIARALDGTQAGDDRLLMFLLRLLRPEVFGRAGRRRITGQVRDLASSRRDSSVSGGPATCEFPDEQFPDNSCSENRPPTVDAGRTG